jgi:predicted alpha-1,2-mannosidase
MRINTIAACILFFTFVLQAQQPARYVNVFVGTDGTGHTFPGPSMPFGMVQPGPDNRDEGWSHTSGYQYQDSILLGFSQTHLSGTGIGDLGDVLLQPYADAAENKRNRYVKASEKASAGYYSVIKKDDVLVELTASERVAFHRYTFPSRQANVVVDFQHGIRFLTDSLVLDSDVRIEDQQTISGYCHTKNWVERKFFFVLQFDRPILTTKRLPRRPGAQVPTYDLSFQLNDSKVLQVKIALSTVDVAGAKRNLKTEVPHWHFDTVRQRAEQVWNQYLGRIDIEAGDAQKAIFYTALYHLLLQPANIADTDGRYRGADDRVALAPDRVYYSTLSIWDIYRGAFPLLQIVAPERINGIVQSMLLHHRAAGFLPIWTLWGQDNHCMIGNHAIPMVLSAYQNGFTGFDPNEALAAMVETSMRNHINSNWTLYNQYGYYPFDSLDNEAVSRTLESGFDDWCVAQMAENMGDQATAAAFHRRAAFYKNLFDPASRLFRGKDSRGRWRIPFDPLRATSPMNNPGDYTEANAWQYFWTPAQHDAAGMIQLLGGKEAFTQKLDSFFDLETPNPDKFLGQEAMIGQYAHGNEPSHHVAYLYAFSNTPRKGQQLIHRIVQDFHQNTPDGMIGNDDCGQMSAWYILSTLGFYPVNAASGTFVLGAPQVKHATIHLQNGRQLVVSAGNWSAEHLYVKEVQFNGNRMQQPYIAYKQMMQGGRLVFDTEK